MNSHSAVSIEIPAPAKHSPDEIAGAFRVFLLSRLSELPFRSELNVGLFFPMGTAKLQSPHSAMGD